MLDPKKTAQLGIGADPLGTAQLGLYDFSTIDVRVSWLQFDTSAQDINVKVSWFEFNTVGTAYETRVSWFQFNTQAGAGFDYIIRARRRGRR